MEIVGFGILEVYINLVLLFISCVASTQLFNLPEDFPYHEIEMKNKADLTGICQG